jgi:hypothetical protein
MRTKSILFALLLIVGATSDALAEGYCYDPDWTICIGRYEFGIAGATPNETEVRFFRITHLVPLPFHLVAGISISAPVAAVAFYLYALRRRRTTA